MFYQIEKKSSRDYKAYIPMVLLLCILLLSSCGQRKGYVVIQESPDNDAFTITYDDWSLENKCELIMKKGDYIWLHSVQESGNLKVSIYGKNGQEAYEGNLDEDIDFRVTIPESDTYIVHFSGKKASGVLKVEKVYKSVSE